MSEFEKEAWQGDVETDGASSRGPAGPATPQEATTLPRPLPDSAGSATKPEQNDLLLILAAHLGGLVGFPIVAPLVVYLVCKDTKPFVRGHALESLNFHITLMAVVIPLWIVGMFVCVTIPVAIGFLVAGVVFSIIAAIRASEGKEYRYPLSFRFVS